MSAERVRELGVRRVRNFTFHHPLGSGGTGNVYLERGRCDRRIAVKINRLMDPLHSHRGRFYIENEARVLAGLSHPHIIGFEGTARTELGPCLAVQYVEGEDLNDYIFRSKGIPYRPALQLFRGLASAVEHIHEQGVVHADIKPGNVRLTKYGLILLDFAFARPEGQWLPVEIEEEPGTPRLLGTLSYLAPERVFDKRPPLKKDDRLALGLIFFEMLTGENAINIDGSALWGQALKQAYQELHRKISLLPIPEPGKNLIRKLIGLSKLGGYADDREILRDIDQLLAEEEQT